MTPKQRKDLEHLAKSRNFKESKYDKNRQLKGRDVVEHIGTNRTRVNGKICFGSKQAKDAINKL